MIEHMINSMGASVFGVWFILTVIVLALAVVLYYYDRD